MHKKFAIITTLKPLYKVARTQHIPRVEGSTKGSRGQSKESDSQLEDCWANLEDPRAS